MSILQLELDGLSNWFNNNDLILNIKNTKFMLFGSNKCLSSFNLDNFNSLTLYYNNNNNNNK
jgi:hypothetical protein